MQDGSMKRFLDLVERTGDKVIVTDPAGEHPYVLMSLDQYERLIAGETKPAESRPVEAKQPEAKHVAEPTSAFEPKSVMKPVQIQSQPLQAERPAPKRSASLWRAQLGREAAAEGSFRTIKDVVKSAPARLKTPALADDGGLDPEGEEKFFLEPLE